MHRGRKPELNDGEDDDDPQYPTEGLLKYSERLKQFFSKNPDHDPCYCDPKAKNRFDLFEPPNHVTFPVERPKTHFLSFIDDPPYTRYPNSEICKLKKCLKCQCPCCKCECDSKKPKEFFLERERVPEWIRHRTHIIFDEEEEISEDKDNIAICSKNPNYSKLKLKSKGMKQFESGASFGVQVPCDKIEVPCLPQKKFDECCKKKISEPCTTPADDTRCRPCNKKKTNGDTTKEKKNGEEKDVETNCQEIQCKTPTKEMAVETDAKRASELNKTTEEIERKSSTKQSVVETDAIETSELNKTTEEIQSKTSSKQIVVETDAIETSELNETTEQQQARSDAQLDVNLITSKIMETVFTTSDGSLRRSKSNSTDTNMLLLL